MRPSYSEFGEDLLIKNLFGLLGISRINYLDLGAFHPEKNSVTKIFYDDGSCGINVDVSLEAINHLKKARPSDININVGIGTVEGSARYYFYGEESPYNTFCRQDVIVNQDKRPRVKRSREVPVMTLEKLLASVCGGIWPYFLNCDLGGSDFEIMQNAPFSGADINSPWVICVAVNDSQKDALRLLMEKKQFFLYARMGQNSIYVKNSFRELVY